MINQLKNKGKNKDESGSDEENDVKAEQTKSNNYRFSQEDLE